MLAFRWMLDAAKVNDHNASRNSLLELCRSIALSRRMELTIISSNAYSVLRYEHKTKKVSK